MTRTMTKQEANTEIAALLNTAYEAIAKAEELSNIHGTLFYFDMGCYGMGGQYVEGEWHASSQSC